MCEDISTLGAAKRVLCLVNPGEKHGDPDKCNNEKYDNAEQHLKWVDNLAKSAPPCLRLILPCNLEFLPKNPLFFPQSIEALAIPRSNGALVTIIYSEDNALLLAVNLKLLFNFLRSSN